MFLDFFYLLRGRGLKVTIDQWLMLIEAMLKGLHGSTLTGFYYLCRAIVVNTEADYDRFDMAFSEYFKDAVFEDEFSDKLMDWLNHPDVDDDERRHIQQLAEEAMKAGVMDQEDFRTIMERLERRLKEQSSEHDTGYKWVGTHGESAFGNSGWHPGGIRVGGQGRYRTAVSVAGERKYRDFRKDNILDTRSFQQAFRTLRQYSTSDNQELEFDIDQTVEKTSKNAGMLSIEYKHPRRNAIKLLMLMDSGGSMEYYANLCSMLFQAAVKSNHFKELHTYYFHNAIDDYVYPDPTINKDNGIPEEWILNNYDSDYRVIIVGDGEMNPYDLTEHGYDWARRCISPHTGLDCFRMLLKKYPHIIWLNPSPLPTFKSYWSQTHLMLNDMFPMYDLSQEGLVKGMRHLMARK